MYFFRVEISSFDDERKTLFIVPEQTEDDFSSVPFPRNSLRRRRHISSLLRKPKLMSLT